MLIFIFMFCLLFTSIYAVPSDEEMNCLVDKISEECNNQIIIKCRETETPCFSKDCLKCDETLENNKENIKSYLSNWIKDWESKGILVQNSYTPLVCTDMKIQTHSFFLDSAFNLMWDGKRVSCPPEVTNITNNWTVFGLNIVSNGGLTIVGITVLGLGGITLIGIGILITFITVIKKKNLSLKNYTIVVQKNSKP